MRTITWNEMELLSVIQWWHDGASLTQIGTFMNISTNTAKAALYRMADVHDLGNIEGLRDFDPQEVVDRYVREKKIAAVAENKKSCDKAMYRRNRRFLSLLALNHDSMFNGQPVPEHAKEKARIALKEVA